MVSFFCIYLDDNTEIKTMIDEAGGVGMTSSQAEQLQALYDKLCSTDGKTVYKLGTGRSFNITSIVGTENLTNYTSGNFIVHIDNMTFTSGTLTLDSSGAKAACQLTRTSQLSVSYNNSTGAVTIIGGVYKIKTYSTVHGNIYRNDTVNATPVVYFCPDLSIM